MANYLNSILIEGNLVKDAVTNETPKGTTVRCFTVASNRFYRKGDETQKEVSFFDCEVWAQKAERYKPLLKKGKGIRAAGRLKQDRWSDSEGKTRSRVKIIVDHMEPRVSFGAYQEESAAESGGDDLKPAEKALTETEAGV